MMLDEWVKTEFLKMSNRELFQIIDADLATLASMRDAGCKPDSLGWQERIGEVNIARQIIRERML